MRWMKRLDERVLGPAPTLTPEQARTQAEAFALDVTDGRFGAGLATLAIMLVAVFGDWRFALLLLAVVSLWWLGFLGYQLSRGRRGRDAARRALIYAFGWSTWL